MTEKNNKDSKEQEEKHQKAPLDPTRYGDWEKNGRTIDFTSSRDCERIFVEKSMWKSKILNQFFVSMVKVRGQNMNHHLAKAPRDDGGTINFIMAAL